MKTQPKLYAQSNPIMPFCKVFDYGADIVSIAIELSEEVDSRTLFGWEFIIKREDYEGSNNLLIATQYYISSMMDPGTPMMRGRYLHIKVAHGQELQVVKCLSWDENKFTNKITTPRFSLYILDKSSNSVLQKLSDSTLPLKCIDTQNFLSGNKCNLNFRYFVSNKEYANPALVIWLHGAGEGGDSNSTHIMANKGATAFSELSVQNLFNGLHVLAPQCPTFWCPMLEVQGRLLKGSKDYTYQLIGLIKEYLALYPCIDRRRIYLAGASMGGYQAWQLLRSHGDLFSAAILSCPAYMPRDDDIAAVKQTPLWFVHSELDSVVPVETSRVAFNKLLAQGGSVEYTEFQNIYLDGVNYDPHAAYFYMLKNLPSNSVGETVFQWLSKQAKP